jgi:hypothetical protein
MYKLFRTSILIKKKIDASFSLSNKDIGRKNMLLLNADRLMDADMTSFFHIGSC